MEQLKKIEIKSIFIENFKGCRSAKREFGNKTKISGSNASGKTTIFDAFTWLLFNKDSLGSEKFNIRPLDANGKMIDNVEIKVSAILEVDGKEVELTKVQKQKWVKKRGSEVAELQGNVNSFEVDGYPKSEKDYKEYISSIIRDDLFKMVTNPTFFTSLKWKEQRDILMRFASDVSDVELAKGNDKFLRLMDELEKAPSTDDIHKKYSKSLLELKKKQAELPVRIDEAEKSKVDIDVAELELHRKALSEQIIANKEKQENILNQFNEYSELENEILKLNFELNDLKRKANEENSKKKDVIMDAISDKNYLLRKVESTIEVTEHEIESIKDTLERETVLIEHMRDKYKQAQGLEFDENSLVCSYCGQEYPVDKKEQIRAEFEQKKADELASITSKGNDAKKRIDIYRKSLVEKEKELASHKESFQMLTSAISDLRVEFNKIPDVIDISETDECKAIKNQIAEKEQKLAKGNNVDDIRLQLKSEENNLQDQLREVEKQIAKAEMNVQLDERISELELEQRDVVQRAANQEKMLYLLEEFIRYKMDVISDSINSKFDGINFKLFENQINGGLKECCEVTVNGVPYSSLNNGHRIVAGLQIIKALQELYEVSAPIFVDNAESVNEGNLPSMNCQMICMYVADNKELKVESEE